jgi:ferredoxin, 2Fe-2S
MNEIKINVVNPNGSIIALDAPIDMGLSLMEFLKASDYDIMATCGGMALCATCHVEIVDGADRIPEPGSDENAMLDTLPDITNGSRLSCQIRLSKEIDGITLRLIGGGF